MALSYSSLRNLIHQHARLSIGFIQSAAASWGRAEVKCRPLSQLCAYSQPGPVSPIPSSRRGWVRGDTRLPRSPPFHPDFKDASASYHSVTPPGTAWDPLLNHSPWKGNELLPLNCKMSGWDPSPCPFPF